MKFIPPKKDLSIVALLIFFFGSLYTTIFAVRSSVPKAVDSNYKNNHDVFSGLSALKSLKQIANSKHPIGSKENFDVYNSIYNQLESIDGNISILTPKSTISWNFTQTNMFDYQTSYNSINTTEFYRYVNDTQVVAFIPGRSNDTLLVSMHYDSIPEGPGAYDDGIAVSVCLEIAKIFSQKQNKNSLMLFFNNGEEYGGGLGSKWFVNSKFKKNVKAFINLEGGGVGGREILFRSSNNELSKVYASLPNGHMNSVGGSVISILGSYTDYEAYINSNIPGLDIAFYENRQFYHTSKDSLDRVNPDDIQHMGANVLKLTGKILDADWLGSLKVQKSASFFDHYGRGGVVTTCVFRLAIVIVNLVLALVLNIAYSKFSGISAGEHVRKLVIYAVYFMVAGVMCVIYTILAVIPQIFGSFIGKKNLYYVSWTAMPAAFFAMLIASAVTAILWKRRFEGDEKKYHIILPIAGCTLGSLFSISFVMNGPLLYLVAASTFTSLISTLMYVILFFKTKMSENQERTVIYYGLFLYGACLYPFSLVMDLSITFLKLGPGMFFVTLLPAFLYAIPAAMLFPLMTRMVDLKRFVVGCIVVIGTCGLYSIVGYFVIE
jgi:hypothetical protein